MIVRTYYHLNKRLPNFATLLDKMRAEEKIIVNEIRKGNKQVYEALFAEYYDSLVRFAQSFVFDQQECEDIVQELFVHIWENSSHINITTSVKAYFYQAIRNKCINYIKSIKVKDKNQMMYADAIVNSEEDLEIFDIKLIESVKESIEELPEQMAKVFKLKLVEGKKREEIAEELGVSVNTVKTQLLRAKTKLREMLKERTHLIFIL